MERACKTCIYFSDAYHSYSPYQNDGLCFYAYLYNAPYGTGIVKKVYETEVCSKYVGTDI